MGRGVPGPGPFTFTFTNNQAFDAAAALGSGRALLSGDAVESGWWLQFVNVNVYVYVYGTGTGA